MSDSISWLALDIGGANIKAAHSSGSGESRPFAVWKHPDDLAGILARFAVRYEPIDRVAITMTAELCDCFATKREGVVRILEAVSSAFPTQPIAVWGLDGQFHLIAAILENPLLAAASNWLALATIAARLVGQGGGLLIDVGSTTTDIIPLIDGNPAPRGRTDTERLGSGELVYTGVRRTPVCALADRLPFGGVPTGLAAELFATTHDVYLTLGALPEKPDDTDTADGRPATREAARDRLARMVGADRDSFRENDALELAQAADEAMVSRLVEAVDRTFVLRFGKPNRVVISGSGAFLAERVAEKMIAPTGRIISLAEAWGKGPAEWGCATALLMLAEGGWVERSETHQAGRLLGGFRCAPPTLRKRTSPLVIKVGGSLLEWSGLPGHLIDFLHIHDNRPLVIVVGAGKVADAIRVFDKVHAIGEKGSHSLALRALELTSRLLASLVEGLRVVESPDEIDRAWRECQIPVFAPRRFMETIDATSSDPLPETWSTTTDSIAARLAQFLGGSELILLKSAAPASFASRVEAANAGFVDQVFPWASQGLEQVRVVNLKEEPWNGYDL